MGPKSNVIGVLVRRRKDAQRQTQRKDHDLLEAEDCWQPLERSKEGTSPRAFRGSVAMLTPDFVLLTSRIVRR